VLDDGGTVGADVVATLPYLMNVRGDGLHIGLPTAHDFVSSADFVTVPFQDTIALGAKELTGQSAGYRVLSHDPLSVTLRWNTDAAPHETGGGSKSDDDDSGRADGGSGGVAGPTAQQPSMTTPLVRGMAYVSALYQNLTPQVTFASGALLTVNGQTTPAILSGTRFELALNSGQTWVLYTCHQVKLSASTRALQFDAAHVGAVRIAALSDATDADAESVLLDSHAGRIPTGADVQAVASGDSASLSFAFTSEGDGDLLMMALPHHMDTLSGVALTDLSRVSLKGPMTGVVGEQWTLTEPLTTIEWSPPRPITDSVKLAAVRSALKGDSERTFLAVDPYGGGKELGAMARLVLIAEEISEHEIATRLRTRLAAKLDEWLGGDVADPLMYEPTYGGLVSKNGLADRGADFGNGWYNDHHFHYGYFLYAAATVGKTDPDWLKKRAPALLHLVRDIANPSEADPLYPKHRFKDWYVGHCWASGLFPSASGRNQESVSESINAWYGLALLGVALEDDRLRDLGRLMIATEVRSGARYWQVAGNDIYPSVFAQNAIAAVVWSTKVDRNTWFGSNIEYTFGIQVMPMTPISELWLPAKWIDSSRSAWQEASTSAIEQWRGLLIMASAVTRPEEAWEAASSLTLFDNGNSRTNTLHWIATRGAAPHGDGSSTPPSPTPPLRSRVEPAGGDGGGTSTPSATDASSAPPLAASTPIAGFAVVGAIGLALLLAVRYARRILPTRARTDAAAQMEAASDAPYQLLSR